MQQNIETMKAEIDLMENAYYIVRDGHVTKVTAKHHGQDIVYWNEGKVMDVDRHDRVRLSGQDVI